MVNRLLLLHVVLETFSGIFAYRQHVGYTNEEGSYARKASSVQTPVQFKSIFAQTFRFV
jgi:hypothetical protein